MGVAELDSFTFELRCYKYYTWRVGTVIIDRLDVLIADRNQAKKVFLGLVRSGWSVREFRLWYQVSAEPLRAS